jgi:hypothetical protein
MSDNFWTALSASATAAAFLAVAWQSVLTRNAVKVAQDALIASEAVALDAARTRLDGHAPHVGMRMTDVPWRPLAWTPTGMPVGAWPTGYEWHFPAKENERIVLQARIAMKNLGGSHLSVDYDGDLCFAVANRALRASSNLISPHEEISNLYLQKDFTVKELSENYQAREEGRPLPHKVTGAISIHDGRDNGVTDTWKFALTGCPVQPDENRGSVWLIASDLIIDGTEPNPLNFTLQPPRQRTYWISRERQVRLPEPTFTPFPAPTRGILSRARRLLLP